MIRTLVLVLFSGAIIAADAPTADKAEKKDQDLIQGTWTVQSATHAGKAVPDGDASKVKVTFKDDTIVMEFAGQKKEGRFTFDSSKKPKEIDVDFDAGKKGLGIYELDGDTFKLCHSELGGDRPKEFKSAEGSQNTLMVFKREKK